MFPNKCALFDSMLLYLLQLEAKLMEKKVLVDRLYAQLSLYWDHISLPDVERKAFLSRNTGFRAATITAVLVYCF